MHRRLADRRHAGLTDGGRGRRRVALWVMMGAVAAMLSGCIVTPAYYAPAPAYYAPAPVVVAPAPVVVYGRPGWRRW
jgi:hypothetical protein